MVAGLAGMVGPQDGMPNKIEVANGVKRLVLGELVAIAQAVGIQHAIVVDNDGVVQTAPEGQTMLAK